MEIIRGLQPGPQRVVLYGPEGIGKSTFGSKFPRPVFIDTEGSTRHLDVARVVPKNWTEVKQAVIDLTEDSQGFQTCVLDTADWAQRMAIDEVCAVRGILSIEAPGYGKGYTYLAEEWVKFQDSLTRLCESGINVVLLAHAALRRVDLPEETGAFDRWELKLEKKISPLVKEWADCILFANYKLIVVTDKDTKKSKARGGERVIHTSHHAAWDAKNRYGLPDELPLDYEAVRHCFECEDIYTKLRGLLRDGVIEESELLSLMQQKGLIPAETKLETIPVSLVVGWVFKHWAKIQEALKGQANNG